MNSEGRKNNNKNSEITLKDIIKHATGEKKLTKEEQKKVKEMASNNRNSGVWGG